MADDVVRYVDPKGRLTAKHTSISADYARAFGTNGKGGRQRQQALADTADSATMSQVNQDLSSDGLEEMHDRQHTDSNNGY